MTAPAIAQLRVQLEKCPVVAGVRQVPETLANKVLAALAEFEQDKLDFVAVKRMRM